MSLYIIRDPEVQALNPTLFNGVLQAVEIMYVRTRREDSRGFGEKRDRRKR